MSRVNIALLVLQQLRVGLLLIHQLLFIIKIIVVLHWPYNGPITALDISATVALHWANLIIYTFYSELYHLSVS